MASMPQSDDRYMDEILQRKAFKELDEAFHPEVVKNFWNRLKSALQLESNPGI